MAKKSTSQFSMKPFFPYYGAKWRMALKYPKPRYSTIIEPFAGGAGYSVNWWNRNVVLYDVNEKVFGTWDYLIKAKAEEILRLPLHWNCLRELPGTIPQEAKWLMGWWINMGASAPMLTRTDWSKESPDSSWGAVVRQRIAKQVEKIKHWKVYNKSYHLIEHQGEATWYIDPPYQKAGIFYPSHKIVYPHLALWSKRRQGQVMVCENEGADWLPFQPFLVSRATLGVSKEAIWLNDPTNGDGNKNTPILKT